MRHLNGVYTQRFNLHYRQSGHLFQGRYKAILVQRDLYLTELARYIVLNPVRAGMVRAAKDWRWSSYRATAGLSEGVSWLSTDWLLSTFAAKQSKAIRLYRRFVAEGKKQPKPWERLSHQVYLGDQKFVEKMRNQVSEGRDLSEIPSSQKNTCVETLREYERNAKNRNIAICNAYASGGYSMKQVGEYFGLHYSWVSRIISKANNKT
jgi:putative transposase